MEKKVCAKFYFDGGADPNPGPAGCGVVCIDASDNEVLAELSHALGSATNNEAEYMGVIHALAWAIENDVDDAIIYGDSKLVIEQMRGKWKCKAVNLQPFLAKARALANRLPSVRFEHVPRESNSHADRLATSAVGMSKMRATFAASW